MDDIIKTIVVGALTALTMVAVLYGLMCILMELKRKDFRSKSGIRVVKKGKIPTQKVECLHCHSIIEYTRRNVWYGGKSIDGKMLRHYVDCPVCHENILVREEKGGEE